MTADDRFTRVVGSRAARLDVSNRALLRVTGPDRVRFLNGMVTNDVEALEPGALCYAALLDRKGRVQSDLWVLAFEDSFLLDPAPGTAPTVAEVLTKHVIADDVEIGPDPWERLVVEGPESRARVQGIGLEPPEADRVALRARNGGDLWVVGRGLLGAEGVQILGQAEPVRAVAEAVALPEITADQLEILCVEGFLPRHGIDVTDRNFVAEARLDHAVSTTKGCYIGQEIQERLRSRGRVNRLLVRISTDAPVRAGDPVSVDGVQIGELTSAVVSPVSGPLSLGYVKARFADTGTVVQVAGARGVVSGPS